MKQVQITHPALVALQGRLREAHEALSDAVRTIEGEWPGKAHERSGLVQLEAGIKEIDDLLTDPTKQASGPPVITDAEYWLALPPAQWMSHVNADSGHTPEQLREAVNALDGLIQNAAQVRGYLAEGITHAKRVTASNRLVTKVRRALGYSYPRQDLNF